MMGWRRVSEWGQPKPEDFPVLARQTEHPGIAIPVATVGGRWEPTDDWFPIPVPGDDEYESPPLPEPWRPMGELRDGHGGDVWIVNAVGEVKRVSRSYRVDDGHYERIAWASIEPPVWGAP